MDDWERFYAHEHVAVNPPSSQSVIDELSVRFNAPIPEPLLRIWRAGNFHSTRLHANLVSPDEILEFVDSGIWADSFLTGGFVPLIDDRESNYICVCIRAPFSPRVVYLHHDADAGLLCRDLNRLAPLLLAAVDSGKPLALYFLNEVGDYPPDTERDAIDRIAAVTILQDLPDLEDWIVGLAIQLLDSTNLKEWATLLETHHFIRRDALTRMRMLKSPQIQELLRTDQQAFDTFSKEVITAAQHAGMKVGELRNGVLKVGESWICLEGFFYRRKVPNAMARIIDWFSDLIAGKDPQTRPGHFQSDEWIS